MMLLYVLEEGIGLCYIEAESSEMKCQSQSGGKFYAEKDATQMVFILQKTFVLHLFKRLKILVPLWQFHIIHHVPSNIYHIYTKYIYVIICHQIITYQFGVHFGTKSLAHIYHQMLCRFSLSTLSNIPWYAIINSFANQILGRIVNCIKKRFKHCRSCCDDIWI